MRYIENIVIGYPIYPIRELISDGTEADYKQEYDKTYFTNKRNLAAILKEIEAVSSISEVRRNKPEYCKELTGLDCFWIKWGKRKFYVIVGLAEPDFLNKEKDSDSWVPRDRMLIGSNTVHFKEDKHVVSNNKRRHGTDL